MPVEMEASVRVLDIIVADVIICLFGYDLFLPLITLDTKHPTEVGSLGIRWQTNITYTLLAVGFAVVAYYYEMSPLYQYLGQALLLVLMILMLGASAHASEKVAEVGRREDKMIDGRQKMRTAIRRIQDDLAVKGQVPQDVRNSIQIIEEKLRYITPSLNSEAVALEQDFVEEADKLRIALSNVAMNEDAIKNYLLKMQRILDNRKQVYS